MVMFAETVIVDYRLSFANQEKHTFVFILQQKMEVCHFRFYLQQTNGSFHSLLVLFSMCVCVCTVCLRFHWKWKMEAANMAPALPETVLSRHQRCRDNVNAAFNLPLQRRHQRCQYNANTDFTLPL
jgi:hypothetical protein